MYMPPFEKLQTNNKEELLKTIRSTKQKMGRLRKKMEHPNYRDLIKKGPSDLTIYKCDRDFLKMAINKYVCLGGEYKEFKKDLKDLTFNERLNSLKRITFCYGDFISNNDKTIIDLSGEEIRVELYFLSDSVEKKTEITKEEFLRQLAELHIGEWRTHYSSDRYGVAICDGEQWKFKLEYEDGKTKTFTGFNAYPYNFEELLELFDCV